MVKNILVTGASRGIGKEIAKGLSREGHNLFLTARSEELLKQISDEINAHYFICDLSNSNELKKLTEFIDKNSIDVLVNNGGEYIYRKIEDMPYKEMTEILSVNLTAASYLCSAVVKNMKSKNWGRIVNIGSISGVMGEPNASLYAASKAGLIGLTKSLALELVEFNVTVNIINPGWVETEMGLKSIAGCEFTIEETLATIPQRRFIDPKEIGSLVGYLISDDAKGITGQSINLCAGLSLGI